MAELLLRALDNPGDPVVMYKTGDVVVVRPDGWTWGSEETKPVAQGGEFWLIKLPGVAVEDLEYLTEADSERLVGQGKHPVHAPDAKVLHHKRGFKLVVPPPRRQQLDQGPLTDPPGWQAWVNQKARR
jgi:hypothetical protein